MSLGSFVSGNGTITASTSSNTITGIGSTFTTDFLPGSVIANATSIFVGYVAYITNNTSLTLTTNSNLNISNNNYYFAPYTAPAPNISYNMSGYINASTTTNLLFGNNTFFISNLNYGDSLFSPNTMPNSIDNFIGKVEMVIDNFTIILSSNSYANVSNTQFYKKSQTTYSTTDFGSSYKNINADPKMHQINGNLYNWSTSGLIPGVSFVHRYHPPIRDSVTGLLVDLPSNTFSNPSPQPKIYGAYDFTNTAPIVNTFSNAAVVNAYSISTTPITAAGQSYTITDFDSEHRAFGTDIGYVHDALYNSSAIQNLVGSSSLYSQNSNTVITNSHIDRFAAHIGANVHRVTDNYNDAVNYFNKTGAMETLQSQGVNLGQNQDFNLRPPPVNLKKLSASGVPLAVPGLLNVKVESDEPTDTTYNPLNYKVIK